MTVNRSVSGVRDHPYGSLFAAGVKGQPRLIGCLVARDGTILDLNQKMADCLGQPREQLIGTVLWPYLAVDGCRERQALVHQVMVRNESFQQDTLYNGRWYDTSWSPWVDDQGEIMGALMLGWDITERRVRGDLCERRRVEEGLCQNEEALRAVFEMVLVGIAEADPVTGQFRRVNRRMCDISGYAAEELLEMRITDLTHPEDREQDGRMFEELVRGERSSYTNEKRYRRRDGSSVWVNVNVCLIRDQHGRALRSLATVEDTTQRREVEQALVCQKDFLERILDSTDAHLAVVDAGGRICLVNAAWRRFAQTNHAGEEGLYGPGARYIRECDPAAGDMECAQEAYEGIRRVQKAELSRFEIEYPCHSPTQRRWFVMRVLPMMGGEGLVLVSHEDITVRREMQEVLARSRAELKAIYDHAPVMMCVVDEGRRVLYANPEFTAFTGTPENDLKGGRACGIFGCINAREDPLGCGFGTSCTNCALRLAIEDTFQTGTVHHQIEYLATWECEGERRTVALLGSTALIGKEDQRILLLCLHDISGLKKIEEALRGSERLYRSLFESMLNGFAYCRMLFRDGKPQDFVYLAVNEAFESQTGLRNVAGKRVSEVIPGIAESDPQLLEIYGRVAMGGKPERFEIFLKSLQMWFWASVYCPAPEHFAIVFDVITERKRMENELKANQSLIRSLAARNAEAEERERQRIARDLHDDVCQNLTAIGLNLQRLQEEWFRAMCVEPPTAFRASQELLQQTTVQIRTVMAELRPPLLDDYGLAAALRWYAEQFSERTGISVSVDTGSTEGKSRLPVEHALFRIAQEALNNASKHAQASRVDIWLGVDEQSVCLEIADNGVGFSVERIANAMPVGYSGWGMLTMAERAAGIGGCFRVESAPGRGATVIVEVPL